MLLGKDSRTHEKAGDDFLEEEILKTILEPLLAETSLTHSDTAIEMAWGMLTGVYPHRSWTRATHGWTGSMGVSRTGTSRGALLST